MPADGNRKMEIEPEEDINATLEVESQEVEDINNMMEAMMKEEMAKPKMIPLKALNPETTYRIAGVSEPFKVKFGTSRTLNLLDVRDNYKMIIAYAPSTMDFQKILKEYDGKNGYFLKVREPEYKDDGSVQRYNYVMSAMKTKQKPLWEVQGFEKPVEEDVEEEAEEPKPAPKK